MTEAVVYVPDPSRGPAARDITYVERVSRNRSIHLLFQDAARTSGRATFLLRAFRYTVEQYLAVGRIEHPVALTRQLVRFFDQLSRDVECRVEDASGLGVYVVLQDGNTFHVLASRDGSLRMRRPGLGWTPVSPTSGGVREVPIESPHAQRELFTHSVRDYLVHYRVDPAPGGAPTEFMLGGTKEEASAVADAVDEPGRPSAGADGERVVLPLISRTVMWCRYEPTAGQRLVAREPGRRAWRAPGRRDARIVGLAGAAVLVCAAVVYVAQEDGSVTGQQVSRSVTEGPAPAASTALKEESPAHRAQSAPEVAVLAPGEVAVRPAGLEIRLAWSRSLPKPVTSTPALADGLVIFGARDGYVHAHDAESGERRWLYRAGDGVGSSPVVVGAAVVAADYEGNVFSLDRGDGSETWKRKLPAKVVSTACPSGGELLVGCTNGTAYGLSVESGRVLWSVETGGRVRASGAGWEGRFFVPSHDGHLYAIAGGSGSVLWKKALGGNLGSSPAAGGGVVYVGGERGGVYAFEAASGEQLWRFATTAPIRSFVGLDGGRVYVGGSDGVVYCLDADGGAEVWRFATNGAVLSRPFVLDGVVFVTSYDKRLYCIEADTGALLGRYETGGKVFSSPVAEGGRVYFGNNVGRFYCLRYGEGATL